MYNSNKNYNKNVTIIFSHDDKLGLSSTSCFCSILMGGQINGIDTIFHNLMILALKKFTQKQKMHKRELITLSPPSIRLP